MEIFDKEVPTSAYNSDLEERKREARSTLYSRSYIDGLRQFTEVLNTYPDDKECYLYLGLHCLITGQIAVAKNLLAQVAGQSSDNFLIEFLLNQLAPKLTEGVSGWREKRNPNLGEPALTEDFLLQIVEEKTSLSDRGIRSSQIPVLITMNDDPMWFWADQLRYIWHVLTRPFPSPTPECRAETDHYLWVKHRIRPGDTVLDIGSNIGLFTNMMSRTTGPSGRVHAFEPNPEVLDDLRRIVQLNQLSNVSIHEVAASSTGGRATFLKVNSRDVTRESSRLGSATSQAQASTDTDSISVTTVELDKYLDCLSIKPNLIKMDIEGAEIAALNGMVRTLKNSRPMLVVEYHQDSSGNFDHDWMRQFLQTCGYRFTTDYKNYFCEPM